MSKNGLIAAPKAERDWQAEDDLHTLMRAAEVKRDPKRMARAKLVAKQRLKDLNSVTESK